MLVPRVRDRGPIDGYERAASEGSLLAIQLEDRSVLRPGAFWTPLAWLVLNLDCAWSHMRFQGYDPAGDRIPGAVEDAASLGVAFNRNAGWFGEARVRYLGEAPPGVVTRPQAPADHRVTVRSFPAPTRVVGTTSADMDSF